MAKSKGKEFGQQVIQLRLEGNSCNKIMKTLNCSKSAVMYYIKKLKTNNIDKFEKKKAINRSRHPLFTKMNSFKSKGRIYQEHKSQSASNKKIIRSKLLSFSQDRRNRMNNKLNFTFDDLVNKIGDNPVCYLTGTSININEPRTYELDHKIPRSRGGDNSLDNLGICSKDANQAKRNMTPDEFIDLCRKVLEHNGYTVSI